MSMSVKYSSVSPVISVGKNSHFASHLLIRHCKFASPCVLVSKRAAIRCQSVTYDSRFGGLEMHFDENDCDECALAACVLRSGYTRSSRSRHSGYQCDLNHIGEQLKLFEKESGDLGGFFNAEKRVYPFFPEVLPELNVVKPPAYAITINKNLFSIYVSQILSAITTKISVQPSTFSTYVFDILLLQCLSTAIYAGIDIAEKAYKANTALFDRVILANDRELILELISSPNCEKSLKQRLKCLEKRLVKKVRGIKVERLPEHYVLTEFYMGFVPMQRKLLALEHILHKF